MNQLKMTKKTIAVVTGASKGIGREIAVKLSNKLWQGSVVIIVARTESDLLTTKSLMNQETVKVLHFIMDLSKPSLPEYENMLKEGLNAAGTGTIKNAIIFHNAGSLGTIDYLRSITDHSTWESFCNLNICSTGILNAAFMQAMKGKKIYAINITSLIGTVAFKTSGMYGVGKAARNYYFKVLALEEPDAVVLNYSPGPVNTEMFQEVFEKVKDETIMGSFEKLKSTNSVLTTDQTVSKLLKILKKGEFKSGDVIDYYDIE